MSNIADFVDVGIEIVRKSWGWFLVSGILLILLGVLCIGKSQTATTFSVKALGWILIIGAAVWLGSAFYTFGWYGTFLYLPSPVIRGVAGYLLITHPNVGADAVTILLSCLFIVLGIFRALTAGVYKFPRWKWTAAAGLVSFGLGIYLLASWYTASAFLFGALIGIDLIFDGAALVGFATSIHRIPAVVHRKVA
jgi:uncharacterized membrane protein HdeD (DUF308 family)